MATTPVFIKETRGHGRNVTDFYLEHLVIVVDGLDEAVRDYRSLGFTVESPREVEDGALRRVRILFADADRTYLALLNLPRPWIRRAAKVLRGAGLFNILWARNGAMPRLASARVTHREGAGDVLLAHNCIEAGLEDAKARSVAIDNSSPKQKTVPKGASVRPHFGVLEGNSFLPFITDDAPPRHTLPMSSKDGAATRHANAVTGVATVTIAVKDLDRSVAAYRALLGLEPCHRLASPLLSVRTVSFSLGGTMLRLAQPTGTGVLKDHLKAHGEGPCALTLRTTGETRRLDDARTHGMRLELVNDGKV